MKKQTFYAIVQTKDVKYRNQLRCPTFEAQLPIFWNKKVAKDYMSKYDPTGKKYQIENVQLTH